MTAKETLAAMLGEMENFITSKTVVGDPVHIDETIILPLVDVSFGVAAGAADTKKDKDGTTGGGGGLGAKMSPSAVLVIKDGQTKLVNVKKQDTVTKLIDLVPDVLDRFTKDKKDEDKMDPKVSEKVAEIQKENNK